MSSRRSRPPRIFSSSLSATERRIYGAVTLIFVGAFLATMWPIAPLFSRIRPFVLGIPFSLFALVFLVFVCFLSLLALYRWEDGRGKLE
jgi:hypothetical protein